VPHPSGLLDQAVEMQGQKHHHHKHWKLWNFGPLLLGFVFFQEKLQNQSQKNVSSGLARKHPSVALPSGETEL
jgi:hypothetical protein